ncbi:MAG: NAD(P)H-dependent oxidoreductase [Flavipsychrobacter sp.]|nr:NAD(P)H-dependent oxidoreductase [Flavipsychrobacter sp.]
MYKLKIITSTVREGRKGPAVARWIEDIARQHGSFEVDLLDLAEINLPMMNEPHHPMLKKYTFDYTKKWSAMVEQADAFIFVTAEYDYNYPAPLRNAIEYLSQEWEYKAAGIISYGGVSAGTRAANSLKGDLATMKMVPIPEMVNFPFFSHNINEENVFVANDISHTAAKTMLDAIVRWTKGLIIIRENL